ncbi:MAG: glycosyltransferase [Thermoleophilia bacterium]
MRLLLINAHGSDGTLGGTEKHLARLLRELPPRGWTVATASLAPRRHEAGGSESPIGTRARRWGRHARDATHWSESWIEAIVREFKPDLVRTHGLAGIGSGAWSACGRVGVPVLHCIHDYYLLCPRSTLMTEGGVACSRGAICRARTALLMRDAGVVRGVVASGASLLAAHDSMWSLDIPRRVILNPFDEHTQTTEVRETPRTLGYIGKLSRIKGFDAVVDVVPALEARGMNLHIAGDGPMREAAEAAARQYPNVRYHGVVKGQARESFYSTCDIGLIPSRWDEPGGPPNAFVEWVGRGRPVIASNRGGLAEALASFPVGVGVEPSKVGIEDGLMALTRPDRWGQMRRDVSNCAPQNDETRWVEEQSELMLHVTGWR